MISITPAVASRAPLVEEAVTVSAELESTAPPFLQLLKTLNSSEKKPPQALLDSLPELTVSPELPELTVSPELPELTVSPELPELTVSPLSIEGLVPQQVEVSPFLPQNSLAGTLLPANKMQAAPVTTLLLEEGAAALGRNVVQAEALLTVNSVVVEGATHRVATDLTVAFFDRVQTPPEANGEAGVSVAVRHPEWGAAIGQRVQALLQQQANHIQIRLDPPELGKLDVQIRVNDAGTQVVFHTEQREVKEALERAFPRLHEMLSMENNANLGFQLGSQNKHGFQQNASGGGSVLEAEDELEVNQATASQNQPAVSLSGINFYA